MRRSWRINVSLARKISLLFGTAVLLTIVATLAFPWLQLKHWYHEALLQEARRIATATRGAVDLTNPNWTLVQGRLDQTWPHLAAREGLPREAPILVAVDPAYQSRPPGGGFQRDAIGQLNRNRNLAYFWHIDEGGTVFRLAIAVRAAHTDRHPGTLRGIIDIHLPMRIAWAHEQKTWNLIITLLAGASGSVLAIVVFYMVTQRLVLSPVHTLRRVAEQVAKGDLDVRSEIAGRDEFHGLSIAFNEMLANLQAAQEAQRRVNRSLDVKLGELAETNVALFEASRIKSDFLSNVSHELRTPLVSIIGFAELLRDAYESPSIDRKRLARYSENILTSGRSLLDIINDLLDLAKIEAGKIELHCSEFSIGTLCKDLADFIRPRVDSRKQSFELEIGDELPLFRSDSGKIKQILYNLLSNAVKFTPEGGSITLRVGRDGADWVRLSVSDTGPGIPVNKRETVFEKFRQLDSSRTREYEGTGLGLAITRELVQILGGRIELESEVGVGSTFKVVLPAVAPQRGAGRAARAR